MAKSPKDYKTRAKNLKALGLLNIDLRKNLTPGMKGAITRKVNALADNYKTLADNPKDFISVKAPTKQLAKNMVDAGYVAAGRNVFIRKKKGFSNYHFEDNALVFEEATADKNSYFLIKNYFPGTDEFFDFSRRLRDNKIHLKRGEAFTLRIGGNSPFQRSAFTNLESFTPYLQLMMSGRNLKESTFEEILPHIQFVALRKRSR